MNATIETVDLTKKYGGLVAVDKLTMTVKPGEVYGFLGPNGAGKTTTLRMLLGLVRPSGGTATVMGGSPGRPGQLANVGAMIEGPAFYPYLSGRANLDIIARYTGGSKARVSTVLDLVDLTDRAADRYADYSLGMKQRLGVAAALMKNPPLLILDEPTNGLDPSGMNQMRLLIRRLGAAGCTVLLSSHLLGEVQQICDRVGIINAGRLVAEDSVDALRRGEKLRIVAEPAATALQLIDRVVGGRARLTGDGIDVDAPAADAARINAELVAAGVAVSRLGVAERDLEDVFFELTGGGSDVAQ